MNEEVEARINNLRPISLQKYRTRVNRLEDAGWTNADALGCGILPKELRHWPPGPRYDVHIVQHSQSIDRELAVDIIRGRIDEWWFRTHEYATPE